MPKNVTDPIYIHYATQPIVASANLTSGTAVSVTGAAAAGPQQCIGILLYDTSSGSEGAVAITGSRVYAIVNSTGTLNVGQPLKASSGKLVAADTTDLVNAILLEAHPGGGDKELKVYVK